MTDKRRAWAVMAVVFIASVAVAVNRFKVPPVLPVLMDELQVDMVTGGWLMSVFTVTGIVLAIPAAFLLNRIGLKLTGLVALGCAIAGAVIGALASGAMTMLVGRLIEGVSMSLVTVLAPTAISQWFPPRERGLPMGVWATWVPIGNVLTFNVAHPLMSAFGWRSVWWFGVLFASAAFVLVGLVVTSPPGQGMERNGAGTHPLVWGQVLLNPLAWLLALAFGAFAFSMLGFNTWVPKFLHDTLNIELAAANAYASLMFVAAIPASITAGWLINRLKDRYRLLPVAFLITTILFFWSFRLGSVSIVVLYMLALGFVSNFIPTAIFTLSPETAPRIEYASLALAIVMVGSNIGATTGPPATGAILSASSWSTASLSLTIVMGVGTLVSWYVARRLRVK